MTLKAQVAFGEPNHRLLESTRECTRARYALRVVKQRLHQASFREAVIEAYGGRCAFSG
jgi:putative restriction endonuclease